jgi:5'(3')-deoxyribonucleotidase
MNLLKEEKKFWQRYFRINNLNSIPQAWPIIGGYGFGNEQSDEYFYFISLRVETVREIILKDSLLTDAGIKHISKFRGLKLLYLRKHDAITEKSLTYFNEMTELESLNVTKTSINLDDMCAVFNNQKLKEVFVSSTEIESAESILEKGLILKERMPHCNFYLDTCFTTNFNGNAIAPIF